MAPMELWQNSSTFVGVVVLWKQKLMILYDDLKNEDEHKNEEDLNIEDKSKILKTGLIMTKL